MKINSLNLSLAGLWALSTASYGATIVAGDVTTTLGPNFFIDDAAGSGGDDTTSEPDTSSYVRDFSSINPLDVGPGGSTITITGFGFHAPGNVTLPDGSGRSDADVVLISITYLGADTVFGGVDDVFIGSESVTNFFNGAGQYSVTFDTPFSATIDGTASLFQIDVTPTNAAGNGSITFKTAGGNAKLSVAGTSVAVPEPSSATLLGLAACGVFFRRRR